MAEHPPTPDPPPHHLPPEPTKMTEKDETLAKTGHPPPHAGHGYAGRYHRRYGRAISMFIVILLVLAGITALTLWLVYRPQKPKFRVISAALYELNTTTSPAPFVSTTMQFTVVTRNPNRRVSFHYDHLSAYVSYKNMEAITPKVILPAPLVHETKTTVALSPVLGGSNVPVAAEVVEGLAMDQANYGVVSLRLVLTGKLRYKAAVAVNQGQHGIYVECDMFVGLRKGFVGQLPMLGSPPCTVDV